MMMKFNIQLFAHKKGQGSTTNGRDSESKRLGAKAGDGEYVTGGSILYRQRGTKVYPGNNVGMGVDHTLYAKVPLPKLSSPLLVVTDFKWSESTVKEAMSLIITFCWFISLFELVLPLIMLITPKLSLPPIPFVKVFSPFKFNVQKNRFNP